MFIFSYGRCMERAWVVYRGGRVFEPKTDYKVLMRDYSPTHPPPPHPFLDPFFFCINEFPHKNNLFQKVANSTYKTMRDREHCPVINILKTFPKKNQLNTGDSALIAAMMIKCISLVIFLVEFCAHRHASVSGKWCD